MLEHHPDALVAVEERGVGYRVNRHFPEGELSGEMILTDLDDIVGPPGQPCDHPRPRRHAPTTSSSSPTPWACTPSATSSAGPPGSTSRRRACTRPPGLQHVADELGVDASDVLAIGDGRNDIEMLRWAGRGVAMGQAVEEVREVADFVTDTVYDDGAAVELGPLVPSRG